MRRGGGFLSRKAGNKSLRGGDESSQASPALG